MKNDLFLVWISFILMFGFIACGDDDKNGDGPELSGIVKALKFAGEIDGNESMEVYEFTYDSQMRLVRLCDEYPYWDGELRKDTVYYSYATNEVTVVWGSNMNSRDTFVYTMEDGRAKSCKMKSLDINYTYDKAGNLISVSNSLGHNNYSFVWKDGNMVNRKEKSGTYEYVPVTPLNNTNIDLNPVLSTLISGCSDDVIFGFWAGILGNRCKNLVFDKEDYKAVKFEMKGKYVTRMTAESHYCEIEYAK